MGGSLTRLLVDFPTDDADEPVPGPRLRAVTRTLEGAGSPDTDIATMAAIFEEHSADRDRTPRFVVIHDGEVLLDEMLPGVELTANEASFDPLPALVPLLMQRQLHVPYLVLEAGAEGGRIRTYFTGSLDADSERSIEGETEYIHNAASGGLDHIGHAHHTEEIWKRNETELADVVNRLVERGDVGLLVVTGDPHVVELVTTALSSRARAILASLASDTIAAGASADGLNAFLAEQLHRVAQDHQAEAIARAAAKSGSAAADTVGRIQAIVDALQQAAVDTLLLDLDALESQSLVSLAGEPWVAVPGAGTFGAEILGIGSAAEALSRAAVATGAEVVFVDHGTLPGGSSAAIVHR
ncbi:MAG: hypothetical protein HIU88_09995 [Acidobacteria bacterium]|nr:hypothetical protein [Acidobacteriota bacterium]